MSIVGHIAAIKEVIFMGGGGYCHVAVVGAHCCHGRGGACPEMEGRIVLWRPAIEPPIVFVLIADGLCNGPGFWHVKLVWVLWMSPPWVWQ